MRRLSATFRSDDCHTPQPTLYHTMFASPQLELLELDDTQWIKVQQRAWHRRTHLMLSLGKQLPLARLGTAALVSLYVQALGEVGRNCFS